MNNAEYGKLFAHAVFLSLRNLIIDSGEYRGPAVEIIWGRSHAPRSAAAHKIGYQPCHCHNNVCITGTRKKNLLAWSDGKFCTDKEHSDDPDYIQHAVSFSCLIFDQQRRPRVTGSITFGFSLYTVIRASVLGTPGPLSEKTLPRRHEASSWSSAPVPSTWDSEFAVVRDTCVFRPPSGLTSDRANSESGYII